MAFWTDSNFEPILRHRFRVLTPNVGSLWITVKSIDLPSYELSINEYQLGNYKIKYPGIVTWNDITATFSVTKNVDEVLNAGTDPTGFRNPFLTDLLARGYVPVFDADTYQPFGVTKYEDLENVRSKATIANQSMVIQTLDSEGSIQDNWVLINPQIKSVNFGNLSYAEDEILEVTVVISYDVAYCEPPEEEAAAEEEVAAEE